MIPFQLDESLPSGSQQAHWIDHTYKTRIHRRYVFIVNKKISKKLQVSTDIDFSPTIITSEYSIFLNFIEDVKKEKSPKTLEPNENFVILDKGKNQTNAYFFSKGKIVFNHYSNIGSKVIDANIADNYEMGHEEARAFKEESGYVFTKKDYLDADEDQKIFGVFY